MKRMPLPHLSLATVALAVCLPLGLTGGARAAELLGVTPQGEEVPAGTQVSFRFAGPVAPLGDMTRSPDAVPFRISPDPGCQWRWLDPSTLACQLGPGKTFSAASNYRITAERGAEIEGGTLEDALDTRFATVRPAPRSAWLAQWLGPQRPMLSLRFNQPVMGVSLTANVVFVGKDGSRHEATVYAPQAENEALTPDTRLRLPADDEAGERWLVVPAGPLPEGASFALGVAAGVRGAGGPLPGHRTDEVMRFATLPSPRFLGLRCASIRRVDWSLVTATSPRDDASRCNPRRGIAAVFSSPVSPDALGAALNIRPGPAPGGERSSLWSRTSGPRAPFGRLHQPGQRYEVWLPFEWRARATYDITAQGVHDLFGRPLQNPIAMTLTTDHREPRLSIAHDQAVLEQGVDSRVPVYLTNVAEARVSYAARTASGGVSRGRSALEVAEVVDRNYGLPLGVRDMLEGRSGLVSGAVRPASALPGVPLDDADASFVAQVTPFQVHVKLGHLDSLAWVTRFADGSPVVGAEVAVRLSRDIVTDPGRVLEEPSTTDADGVARFAGLAQLDPGLEWLNGGGRKAPKMALEVRAGDDMAVVPLRYNHRIYGDAPYASGTRRFGHLRAFGVTAQGVYRPGETVRYKLWLRDVTRAADGGDVLGLPPGEGRYRLSVVGPRDNVVVPARTVALSEFGSLDGEFTLPESASFGHYQVKLNPDYREQGITALTAWVTDFTPAPFSVAVEFDRARALAGAEIGVATRAALFAGGPYASAASRTVARVSPAPLQPASPALAGFYFDTRALEADGTVSARSSFEVLDAEGTLDSGGMLRATFDATETRVPYGRLRVESSVRDDRGGRVAGRASVPYASRLRFVGLKRDGWVERVGEQASVGYAVVDPAGEPLEGAPVSIRIEREKVLATRVLGPGNAYLTRYLRLWQPAGSCEGTSAAQPGTCLFTPRGPGAHRVVATVPGIAGAPPHSTEIDLYAVGAGELVWAEDDATRLGLVPDQARYAVGDTVKVLVRNPFPGASALVTVERYGVQEAFVTRLQGSTPVIEVPVTADFAPGFYLSVLVHSPRTGAPLSSEGVDLGKPTYRLGYQRIEVTDSRNELEVAIRTDQPSYRPGGQVRADLHVTGGEPGPREVAIAVLDESVLALLPNGERGFDPHGGLHRFRSLDVINYSLLTRLVGRQKLERKGDAPPGDGEGPGFDLRERLDFVAHWAPSVITDRDGRASIDFALPDNITGWRVIAMAADSGERLGLGSARFTASLPTELSVVMPNRVRAGDEFEIGFAVRNRTDEARTLSVNLLAEGSALERAAAFNRTLQLGPSERKSVFETLRASAPGEIRIEAEASDESDGDALAHRLRVDDAGVPETVAAAGGLDARPASDGGALARLTLAVPDSALPGSASLQVEWAASRLGALGEPFAYFRDYPHACWEQQLTRGVAAAMHAASPVADSVRWPGSGEEMKRMLSRATAFQAPNGGMAFWRPDNRRADPYLSAFTALALRWTGELGGSPPVDVEQRLHDYLEQTLRRDAFPGFDDPQVASDVRAVALAARAARGELRADDIARYERALPRMSLFGKSQFLGAAAQTPGAARLMRVARDAVLSHGQRSANTLAFTDGSGRGAGAWLLGSNTRSTCAALDGWLHQSPDDADVRRDAAAMLASIEGLRAERGRWDNTQENLWCLRAMTRFADAYESAPLQALVRTRLDGRQISETLLRGRTAPPVRHLLARGADLLVAEKPLRTLELEAQGRGTAWYTARLDYRDSARDDGYDGGFGVRREYAVRTDDGRWRVLAADESVARGELVRVDLFVQANADQTHVALTDPVPGGFEPVNRALATTSQEAANAAEGGFAVGSLGERGGWRTHEEGGYGGFYHRELGHRAARFYAERLPAGRHHLRYVAQVIAAGRFEAPPAHAEAMYAPATRGRGAATTVKVTHAEE